MNNRKNKIIRGGASLAAVSVLSQLLSVILNVVLARLLFPEDFGLIALATTYIGFVTLFSTIGFGSSIIHEQNSSQKQLSSLYWLNMLLAVFSFVLIVSFAAVAADFYHSPQLTDVIYFAAISILITPLYIIHYKIYERDLSFKLLSKVNLISTFSGALAAVIGAYAGLNVFSLVVQVLVSGIVKMILILSHSDWKPSLVFSFPEIKSMIWYSFRYKASNTALYFERNVDYLILGKGFDSVVLGYYAFAYNIMYMPVKRIAYIFSNILFPSFSAVKNDTKKIISGFFKSSRLIAIVSFPAMAILSFNAEFIVQFVFGHKWDAAIPIVQILSFAGAIQSVSQPGGVIFPSIGKPEFGFYLSVGRAVLVSAAIIVGMKQGIIATAYMIVVAKVLSFLLFLSMLYYFIPFRVWELLKHLAGPLCSVLVLFTFHMLNESVLNLSGLMKLSVMSVLALSVLYLFDYQIIKEILLVLRTKKAASE